MSSPAESLIVPEPVFDRRFYPRTAPSSLTHVLFGPEISGQLIDLGENGVRLGSPFELSSNFVCRATLPLSGLERPIEVCVRVVWTGEANQAGIQFMDLSDEDRGQIRKWMALQENAAAPVESTEILNDPGTQDEPKPERIQATQVVTEAPNRRNRIGIAIALAAACVAVLTATGLAVWASPLGSWLTKSLAAGTKSVFATAKTRDPGNASSVTPFSQTEVQENAVAAKKIAAKNEEQRRAEVKAGNLAAADEIVNHKGVTHTAAAKVPVGTKYSAQVKSIAKANANAIPATPATSVAERNSNSDAPAPADDHPDGDAAKKNGEEKIETKLQTGLSGADVARPSGITDALPPASGTNAHVRPRQPDPPSATISGAEPGEPEIIQTPEPTSRAVDVMLPNSPRPSLVSVPGERVFQSSALTLRIQRAIVAPAGHATWSTERKRKVVLGDLLSRVDPRAPRTVDDAGSRVSVRVMLGRDGTVERLMPVNGPAELVPRVMRAVREWRFQPTLLDGKPVETAALVTIEFRGEGAAAAKR